MKNILRIAIFFVYLWGNVPFLFAQESCYEQYFREHNKEIFPAIDENDDSYDELKKMALARQIMYNGSAMVSSETERADQYVPSNGMFQPLLLAIDTVTGICHLLSEDGAVLATAHIALVDSTWYMWLSVDPLVDKNIANTPYMYCNGNPIMLIDPDGREPSKDEAAAMAACAYGDADNATQKKINQQLGKWKVIGEPHEFSGYRAVMFGREVDGKNEYAYAFAGTDSHSIADIVSDIAQATDLPSQYELAIGYARAMVIKYKGSELTFVGHSLGGGEATAAAMATGKKAITFNPAAVSLSTVVRNMLVFPANIDNYVVSGDPLTIGQKLINPVLVGGLRRSGLITLPGNTAVVPKTDNNAHSITNFIK